MPNGTEKPTISRRRFAQGSLAIGGSAALLSGRGSSVAALTPRPSARRSSRRAQATDTVSPLAASGGLKDTTITLIMMSGPELDAHKRLAPRFTEFTQGKVKVRIEEGGRGDAYTAKWLAGLQAQTTAWDVLHDESHRFLGSGPAGFFAPMSAFMADEELFEAAVYNNEDFPQSARDIFTYDGEQMLMVQEASAVIFQYRTDLFQKYGVPEPPVEGYDWDAFLGHLKTLQGGLSADGQADVFPLIFGAAKPSHSQLHIVQNGWAKGGELFDGVKPTFDHPAMVEAAELLVGLRDSGYVSDGVPGYEYPEVATGFQSGKAAIAFQWNAAAPDFLDPAKSPATAGKLGFSALPYFKDRGPEALRQLPSMHGIGVSAFSENQQEAFAYCAWFTSQEIARDYVTNGGGSSGRSSLLNDPSILGENPQYKALGYHTQLNHPYPPLSQFQYVYFNVLGTHASEIWAGQVDAKTGLARASEEAATFLEDEGVL